MYRSENQLSILKSYWFTVGLSLLLLNDFLLKTRIPGWFTGKLSDFAGLFVFTLFWCALFPRFRKCIVLLCGLTFIFWKSVYANGFIDFWNSWTFFRISRVVDYSDYMALLVLPLAYFISLRADGLKAMRLSPVYPLLLATFAFGATSYERNYDQNKLYEFDCSKHELLDGINTLDTVWNARPISFHIEHSNDYRVESNDTLWYYRSGYNMLIDTMYRYRTKKIDTICHHQIPVFDTAYVNGEGIFYYWIPAKKYMNTVSSTSYCEAVMVRLRIYGDSISSFLVLEKTFTSNCMGIFEKEAKKVEEKILTHAFEKELIEKLR